MRWGFGVFVVHGDVRVLILIDLEREHEKYVNTPYILMVGEESTPAFAPKMGIYMDGSNGRNRMIWIRSG